MTTARKRSRSSAKAAGARFERDIADYEADHIDDRIDRAPKHGARDRGDIAGLRVHGQRITQEAKNCARLELGTWLAEAEVERINDQGLACLVISKRHGIADPGDQVVHMTLRDFVALITGTRPDNHIEEELVARIRTIKPGFFRSEDVSELPFRARLTWVGLWTHCDDAGRAKDNTKLIKADIWPLDPVSLKDVEEDLETLAAHGRIVRYEVDGRGYLEIVNWDEHQRIQKPSPSKIPPPPVDTDSCRTTGTVAEDSGSGTGSEAEDSRSATDRKGKERKGTTARKPRQKDEIWDALMDACGVQSDQITDSSRGAYNRAVKDLKAIEATPGQITLRARRYRQTWPNASLTPTALVRRWAELNGATGSKSSAPEALPADQKCEDHLRPLPCSLCKTEQAGRRNAA